jgi:hypothetical protein
VEVEVRTQIHPDGSGVQQWSFTSTALLATKVRDQIKNGSFFKGMNLEFSEEYKEGDFILKTQIPFQKVEQLKNPYFDVQLAKSGFFKTSYGYTQTWKARPENSAPLFQDSMSGFGSNSMKISVEMKGTLTGSNADHEEGSTAHWNIPMSQLNQNRVLKAQWTLWNVNRIAAAGILLGSAVLALFIILRKHKNISVSETDGKQEMLCSGCGSNNPVGSVFCNKCGAKLPSKSDPE